MRIIENESAQMVMDRLKSERMRKLESTLNAYDTFLNTPRIDAMRKHIDAMEKTLATIADSGILSGEMTNEINAILSKKFL